MAIELEKILPMSAKDWCESQGSGKTLFHYKQVGVHYFTDKKENLAEGLAKKVPEEAVIVTDYDFSTSVSTNEYKDKFCWGQATGTALIPKNLGTQK